MRMIVPTLRERKHIIKNLEAFYNTHKKSEFNAAIKALCDFFKLKKPVIRWVSKIDDNYLFLGKTYEDGTIDLIHPEHWVRKRMKNKERIWVNTVLHEMGHYVFWVDAEAKANKFATKMEQGLNE